MSAYACHPGAGSEPGTGWAWACAAAQRHEVWLLTRANERAAIDAALAALPDLRLRPVYLDLPESVRRWKRQQRGVRLYYVLWQRQARRMAARLHAEHRFDVAHHVTFASDWLPAGVVGIAGLPSVWGPVGGSAPFPWSIRRELGPKGVMFEIARATTGWAGRSVFGRSAARRAAVVVAQNDDVAARFARHQPVIEPHVAIDDARLPVRAGRRDAAALTEAPVDLLFVGRLIAWKGVAIAIRALPHLGDQTRRLTIVGTGGDRARLERLAEGLGIADRVEFLGQVPREMVLELMASATALVHPSVHDSAPWAVAEAIAMGLPVAALDTGGPSLLVRRAGGGALARVGPDIAESFARAIESASAPHDPSVVSVGRIATLLDRWYLQAIRPN